MSVETSWLPNIAPVRSVLSQAGFERDPRGAWLARVGLDDHLGVMRKVSRALELQLLEASSLIPEESP